MGRPTKFKPEYCEDIVTYFSKHYRNLQSKASLELPFFEDYAWEVGVTHDTLLEWTKPENREKYPNFSEAYRRCKEIQKKCLIFGGTSGFLNATFTIFTAKNITDMRDQTHQEITGKDGEGLFDKVTFKTS